MKCEVCKGKVAHLPFLWIALVLDTHTGCSVDTDVKASKDFLRNKALSQLFINAFQQINHNTPTRLAKHWGQVKEYGLGISKDLESKSMGYGTSFMLLRKIVLNW